MSSNGNGKHPSANGGNGRDTKGRFAPGWKGGPGNPHGRKVAKFRSLFLDAATPERVTELIELLWDKAIDKQEQWAILEILNRIYGKPKETIKVEQAENPGDPFEMLKDPEVTDVIDRVVARRQAGAPLAEPGSSRN